MKEYIGLSKMFVLRNTDSQLHLHDLRNGNSYVLTNMQYEFLLLLSGKFFLDDILSQYDQESRATVISYVENLKLIGAINFSKDASYRNLDHKAVPDRRLEAVHLEADSDCNMACVHCYQFKYSDTRAKLNNFEIVSLLDQMQAMQVNNVGISGGEPLLMPNLYSIMRAIEDREMRISALFTNGTLIGDEYVDFLKSLKSKFGTFISLDAISASSMSFRGYESKQAEEIIDRIINSITKLTANDLRVVVNTVVHSGNIYELDKMYDTIKRLNVNSWRVGFPKLTTRFKSYSAQYNLEWNRIADQCFKLLEKHIENKMPFHLQIEYLFREELFLEGRLEDLSDDDFACDYEGRRSECCIKPNGDVVSCAYCYDMPIGNIKQAQLSDIWYSKEMKKTKMVRIGDVAECKDCKIRSICGTGCRANANFLHSNFWHAKDDYACQAVQFFQERVVPLFKQYNILK